MNHNYALGAQVISRGLYCDRPGCDYRDETIPFNAATIRAYTNAPCPKCGANLLTEADARTSLRLLRVVAIINVLFFPLLAVRYLLYRMGWIPKTRWHRRHLHFDGSGLMQASEAVPEEERSDRP